MQVLALIWLISWGARAATPPVFRFHLFSESHSIDPQLATSAGVNYLSPLLYRGLYSYSAHQGLKLAGAKACQRQEKKLVCTLSDKHRWSNGSAIRAEDYVLSFRRLVDPKGAYPQADLLNALKNARAIIKREKPVQELGVVAADSQTLIFEFAESDPEFEFKLIHPALTPFPPGGYPRPEDSQMAVVSGPYKITQWKKGSWIRLAPNPQFTSIAKRPLVEAWFVEDDSTALSLFESGKLDFLRRLVNSEIPRFRNRPGFYQVPMARFDYVGFGPALAAQPQLRKALVEGVDFQSFLKLIDTLSPPGCPSLPASYMDKTFCLKAQLTTSKTASLLAKVPMLEFYFSRMGGEDIARQAEWFQAQWRKNLGLKTELKPQEQGSYLARLKQNPPAIFRKGVSLDRPTCAAALEIFFKGHPENYIQLDDPEFEKLAQAAAQAKGKDERRQACRVAVEHLLKSHRLIPLGEMFFTILANEKFKGWDLNELNQLDLSELEARSL